MAVTRLTTNGLTGTKYDIASADNYYMEPIATQLLTGTATTITFSNIPSGYKHLQVRYISAWTGTSVGYGGIAYVFNSDTGANYAGHELYGTGSSTGAGGGANRNAGYMTWIPDSAYANTFGAGVLDILDYSNINKYKTGRCFGGFNRNFNASANELIGMQSALWMNTAAITSITFSGNTFAINSRFSLYGIKG
jgi:hypothetical protein